MIAIHMPFRNGADRPPLQRRRSVVGKFVTPTSCNSSGDARADLSLRFNYQHRVDR